MRIPQNVIDQVLDRTDLVELIGARVPLKKSGRTFSACCPFHGEKSPSFHVRRDKGYYHCFGCQASGNAVTFLMQYENQSFMDALQQLAQHAGVTLPKVEDDKPQHHYKIKKITQPGPKSVAPATDALSVPLPSANPAIDTARSTVVDETYEQVPPPNWSIQDVGLPMNDSAYEADGLGATQSGDNSSPDAAPEEGNLYDLLEQVTLFYQLQLQRHLEARQYFTGRGLDGEACISWRLGYALGGWQHLQEAFPQHMEGLIQLGLIKLDKYGKYYALFRDRVMFPIRDHKGRVVAFGGRAMNNEIKPKYLNSAESVMFNKSRVLYGLYESKKARAEQWLMVEGYMDVIALHQAGIPGAVATLGTATNIDHLTLLFKQSPRLTLAFDGDTAGQNAAKRTLELCLPVLNDGRELRFLTLPDGQDPDSLVKIEGKAGLQRRIEQAPPLSDFLYNTLAPQYDLTHPEGKSHFMQEVQRHIEHLPKQGVYRQLLRQAMRERIGLSWKKPAHAMPVPLDFAQHSSRLEDKILILLLQYPFLADRFKQLSHIGIKYRLLEQLLQLIQQSGDYLPEDSEQATFFLLGAWQDNDTRSKICHLLESIDLAEYTHNPDRSPKPELLDSLAHDLFLQLQEQLMTQNLKAASSNLSMALAHKQQQIDAHIKRGLVIEQTGQKTTIH